MARWRPRDTVAIDWGEPHDHGTRERASTKTSAARRRWTGVDLEAGPGVTGLLGPNGAGKTTLLRIIATVLAPGPRPGPLLGRDPRDARRTAWDPPTPGLPAAGAGFHRGFTVFEFVDYVAILKEMTDRRARHDEVRRVDRRWPGWTDVSAKRIRALSGGMRRRVGLAQALLGDPDLLVLDEPTVGLDPEQRLRFREMISRAGEGRTVVLSTPPDRGRHRPVHPDRRDPPGPDRFTGTPAELTGTAAGRVWTDRRAVAGRTGGLAYRRRRRTATWATAPAGAEPSHRRWRTRTSCSSVRARRRTWPRERGATTCSARDPRPGPGRDCRRPAASRPSSTWRACSPDGSCGTLPCSSASAGCSPGYGFALPDTPYERYSAVTGLLVFLAGPSTFFASNLVATSERRRGAERLDAAHCRCLPCDRTSALLLSGVAAAAAALVLDLLLIAVSGPGQVGPALRWAHVATVPVAVLGAAVLGVAVARLLPWPGAPLVVMVGLVAANVLDQRPPPLPGALRRLRRVDRHRRGPGHEPGLAGLAPGLPGGPGGAGRVRRGAAGRPPAVAALRGRRGLRGGRARRRRTAAVSPALTGLRGRQLRAAAEPLGAGGPLAAGAGGRRAHRTPALVAVGRPYEDATVAVWLLRGVALMLAASLPFGLDDGSRATLAAVPDTAVVAHRWSAAPCGACRRPWCGPWPAGSCPVAGADVPVGGLTLEALALGASSTALATVAVPLAGRHRPGRTHRTGGRGAGTGSAAAARDGPRSSCRPAQGGRSAHLRWLAVLAAAVLVAGVAMSDPGRSWRASA